MIAGLFLYDPGSNAYSGNFMPAKTKVVTLCPDKQGVLWIGSDGTGLWTLSDNASFAKPIDKKQWKTADKQQFRLYDL